jgi:hypothetical protein
MRNHATTRNEPAECVELPRFGGRCWAAAISVLSIVFLEVNG